MQPEIQLARMIYHRAMSTLKFTLEMEEQQYQEKGRQDTRYKFFKKMLMATTYDNIRALFGGLKDLGVIIETDYPEDLKNGYQDTESGGSGYLNSADFDEWIKSGDEPENSE